MSVADELKGMTEIALFAGAGGGVLGSKMLGIRTVAYVEWDAFPQAILKARMADGLLEDAPVFGDVREFDPAPYAGKTDIVSGGFPCQPFSTAGRQEADFDPRNMWPATRDIIRGVRPKYAYLENVAGLLTGTHGYFGVVLGELAASGYDVAWTCLPAAAVGAPHRRDRLWILGRRRDEGSAIVPEGTLSEFARFDTASKAWCRFDGRCRGDTASTVASYIVFPRSGTVALAPDGTTTVYALDPVSQADGTTRGGWPWPRILEDLRIHDPAASAVREAPVSSDVEMLPTPNAFDAYGVGAARSESRPGWSRHGVSLHHLAAEWSSREGRTFPTPLAGNATPGEGGNHGGMALRAAAEGGEPRKRKWATPTAGISKESVTPGMADRADRKGAGNLLEDVAQSLYGEGAEPPDTAWPDGTRTWPTPTVRDMKGASQSFVETGLRTGHYSGLDGAVVGAAVEDAAAEEGVDALEMFRGWASNDSDAEGAGDPQPDSARVMWPTPQAASVSNNVNVRSATKRSPNAPPNKLGWAVGEAEDNRDNRENWPTPSAGMYKQDIHDSGQYAEQIAADGRQITLAAAVKLRTTDGDAWPTPRAKGLVGGSSVYGFRESLVDGGAGTEEEVSAMFQLRPRQTDGSASESVPVEEVSVEMGLDDLVDLSSDDPNLPWHIARPTVKVKDGVFPTPSVADSVYTDHDGFSDLGRFVQNDGKRPPRRTKEEREAARANRGPVGQLNPDWVEWLMGWPVGWTSMSPMTRDEAEAYATAMPGPWWRREPAHIPRITVGTADRAGRLKACGNGQVSLANAAAFEVLLETFRQIEVACAHGGPSEIDALDILGL